MNEMFLKHFLRCDVTERESPFEKGKIEYLVDPVWKGVDRSVTGGWVAPTKDLAYRLQRAVESGKVFSSIEVMTDVNNRTFIMAGRAINWKRPHSALAELGF